MALKWPQRADLWTIAGDYGWGGLGKASCRDLVRRQTEARQTAIPHTDEPRSAYRREGKARGNPPRLGWLRVTLVERISQPNANRARPKGPRFNRRPAQKFLKHALAW